MDIYSIVTEKTINLLEQGIVPWHRPWTSAGLPRNIVSKKSYRGINHFCFPHRNMFHRFGSLSARLTNWADTSAKVRNPPPWYFGRLMT